MPSRPALRRLGVAAVGLALLGGFIAVVRTIGSEPEHVRAQLSIAEALAGGDAEGFRRAEVVRAFSFPEDHGPHPGYRTEWWYYTGNLATTEGRRFGFQLTFFRYALAPRPIARASTWAAHEIYLAHFAVTDVAAGRFHAFERLSRAALGLAAARAEPLRVWLEDWSAEAAEGARRAGVVPMLLRAAADGVALDLTVESRKPVVLQGERGLSRKSDEPGNASYYYSLTRLEAQGTVAIGGERHRVRGLAWMDREWSTSALGAGQVGWDWFALQLSDGREVTLYRLRRRDGSADPASQGTLVAADGAATPLALEDVALEALATWRSPRDGRPYPARWRLRIPRARLDLTVTPLAPDQELDLTVRYWEGAVAVDGTSDGRAIDGHGYVELTGYGDAEAPRATGQPG